METKYVPIDCSYHDLLLDRATRRKQVTIDYKEAGQTKSIHSRIVDVFTRNKEEFLKTEEGILIRLDFLVAVDGVQQAGYGTCSL